jgi:hypothetical protein
MPVENADQNGNAEDILKESVHLLRDVSRWPAFRAFAAQWLLRPLIMVLAAGGGMIGAEHALPQKMIAPDEIKASLSATENHRQFLTRALQDQQRVFTDFAASSVKDRQEIRTELGKHEDDQRSQMANIAAQIKLLGEKMDASNKNLTDTIINMLMQRRSQANIPTDTATP